MVNPDDGQAQGLGPDAPFGIDPAASQRIFLGMLALGLGGMLAFYALKPPTVPTPIEIASDPLLVEGRAIFLGRCISCHGPTGKGDGPLAKSLTGPPVGDLTSAKWKHGDTADEVQAVIANGVANAQMPGWKSAIAPSEIAAVSAYVYFLAGREVPAALRTK